MNQEKLVLLTGATGFVGAYMLRLLLQKGYRVRALRRANSPMDLVADVQGKVEWFEADLGDLGALEDAFEGVTHVCHCAAMVSFRAKDVAQMRRVNVTGTANLVNLSLDFGVQKFIHVSSIAAIGRSRERPQLDETAKWVNSSGNTQYAVSKYLSEQEVWRGQAEGLTVAVVNPAIILGSGFWQLGSAKFFKQIYEGLRFCPVGCSGFVDVRDVARFMLHLLESDVVGERFILNAQDTTYREFFHAIAAAMDKKAPSITVTPLLAEVAWRVEWLKEKLLGLEPVVTKETARSSVSSYFYDNAKSKSVFNFQYTPLEQTIRETAAQYLMAVKNGEKPMVLMLNAEC